MASLDVAMLLGPGYSQRFVASLFAPHRLSLLVFRSSRLLTSLITLREKVKVAKLAIVTSVLGDEDPNLKRNMETYMSMALMKSTML